MLALSQKSRRNLPRRLGKGRGLCRFSACSARGTQGENTVEVRVINLWPNRLIGDAQPGAGKVTFTANSFYQADSDLFPAGLVGPVKVTKLQK